MYTVREDLANTLAAQTKWLELARTKVSDALANGQSLDSYALKKVIRCQHLAHFWGNIQTIVQRLDEGKIAGEPTLVQVLEAAAGRLRGEMLDWTPRQSTDQFDNWADLIKHEARKEFLSDLENVIRDAVREAEGK